MARNQAQNTQSVTQGSVTLKIYEVSRGTRTIYSVAHKDGGRRQLKQFSDMAAALTWAATPAFMLSPDEGAMYQRAKQILAGTGKALDEIAREYVDARDTLGGAVRLDVAATYYAERRLRLVQRTVPEVVKELLEARAHKSIRHVKDLNSRLGRFAREVIGYIANVTQRDLALWLRGLGLSSRSHDNFRQVLVPLFRFAQKQGYLPEGRTEAEKTEPMGDNTEGEILGPARHAIQCGFAPLVSL
jgi:hypothetical protein